MQQLVMALLINLLMTLWKMPQPFLHLVIYNKIFLFIQQILQELFEDISDFEQQMDMLAMLNREVAQVEEYVQGMEVDALVLNPSFDDSDDADELECLLPEFDLQFWRFYKLHRIVHLRQCSFSDAAVDQG